VVGRDPNNSDQDGLNFGRERAALESATRLPAEAARQVADSPPQVPAARCDPRTIRPRWAAAS